MALLTALILLPGLPHAMSPTAAAASGPTVYWGANTGPVDIRADKAAAVAALSLPAGRYLVTAAAALVARGGPMGALVFVDCRLVLGSGRDGVTAYPAAADRAGSRVPILLTVAGRLGSAGKTRLRCNGGVHDGDVRIRDIRISAVAVGKLTLRDQMSPPGTSRTYGSGSPRVISWTTGLHMGSVVDGDDKYHDIGSLDLPAGRWWVMAKAATDGAGSIAGYTCRLSADIDYDDVKFGLAVPVALQVVHWFRTHGRAVLQCKGPAILLVSNVTITAIKAGSLTDIPLDPTLGWSTGSGSPAIISGYADGLLPYLALVPASIAFKTIRKLSLPKGRWTVLAKLWFEGSAGTSGIQDAWCRLAFGKQKSPTQIHWVDDPSAVAPMVLSIDHRAKSRQPVKLQCRRWSSGGIGNAYFIKITAMKAGTLAKRHL